MRLKKCISIFLLFVISVAPVLTVNAAAEDLNLALKKSYTITYESPIENAFTNYVHNDDDNKLTDGNKAQPVANDNAWLRFYRGTAITVDIDLGTLCAVNGVNVGQLQLKGAGIHCSRYVNVYLSEDGNKFNLAGSLKDEKSITGSSTIRVQHSVKLGKYFKARYVRVTFSSDVWSFNDEIEVIGSGDSSIGESAPATEEKQYVNTFPGDVDGLHNIMLIYSGEYYNGSVSEIGRNTYAELLPYFTYVDKTKKPTDTFFDGMLFLPLNPVSTESTSADYGFAKKSGWEIYLKNVIGKGATTDKDCNLTALDKLVGDNREALGLSSDYKYPVYISVPFIEFSDSAVFGNINGEDLMPSNLDSRVKIVKWFVDSIVSSFNNAGFKNIKLNGMYWQEELVPYSQSEYEDDLIIAYNKHVHEKGYSSIWIPYYCAPGYESWKELGFDAAVVQNGYPFVEYVSNTNPDKKPEAVDDSLAQAKKYGLGMEVELSGKVGSGDKEGIKRLNKCLQAAYSNGLMKDGLVMYYQGGGPGTLFTCANSQSAEARAAYDLVYKFVSGTFTSFAPSAEKEQLIIIKKGSKAKGNIIVTDNDSEKWQLKSIDFKEPKNVKALIQGVSLLVNSESDFLGEDSFSFKMTDGFNVSEEIVVRVLVVEELIDIKAVNEPLKDNTANRYDLTGNQTGTDANAFEIVVGADGKIAAVGGNNNTVPQDGYIIAAAGTAKEYLQKYSKVGLKVIYDKMTGSAVFEGITDNNNDQSSETSNSVSNGNEVMKWIVIGALLGVLGAGLTLVIIKTKNKKGAI